jgi:hypothetical protein
MEFSGNSRPGAQNYDFQMDEGMRMDWSDGQSSNAANTRTESRELGSNVTLQRLLQYPKHDAEIVSTDVRIPIDWSERQLANAASPRTETLQPLSSLTLDSFEQQMKHSSIII